MISFLNDYNEIANTKILEALMTYKDNKYVGYSEDEIVKQAVKILKKELNDENIEIHFVHGGTIANVLGIMLSLQRYQSVIAADTGHIVNTENASIEAVGHQIVLVPNKNGKVTIEQAKIALKKHIHEYNSQPKIIYISNVTEIGTVYKKEELENLSDFCRQNNLYLFMDGARLGSAMMSHEADVQFSDLTKYLDAFTIGGTKNGFMFGEAIVLVNEKLKNNYARMVIKQRGALLAKGFIYGIQFNTMFEDGLYFRLAEKAINMAKKLEKVLLYYNIKPLYEVNSNLIFVEMSRDLYDKLSESFLFSYEEIDDTKGQCRFVTTWNTKDEEIEKFGKRLNDLK